MLNFDYYKYFITYWHAMDYILRSIVPVVLFVVGIIQGIFMDRIDMIQKVRFPIKYKIWKLSS